MQIIINADDLGKGESENTAICALVDSGVVTSATIMANGPGFQDAVQQMQRRPTCSIGVHLNITEFAPLTSDPGLRRLLSDRGQFRRQFPSALVTPALLRAVYFEWRAQIQAVLRAGISPSHLDSHHHIHTLPQFFRVRRQLQTDFGIWRVRRPKNVYEVNTLYTSGVHAWRSLCHVAFRISSDSVTTDAFTDLRTFLSVHKRLKHLGSIEIMVHPGHRDHVEEGIRMQSDELRMSIRGHKLIGYRDLPSRY